MKEKDETYIGDAIYASFDGYQIKLRTDDDNNQIIYLEPSVFEALVNYVEDIHREIRSQGEPTEESLS